MKEFLLILRREGSPETNMSPEQIQAMMKPWQDWMGSIAAQDKLVSSGARLAGEGMVIKPGGMVTNGPFADIKEIVGGYIIIRAASLEEAAEICKNCPILTVGGNVEVRPLIPMEN
jgi:hypothetical protein